MKTNGKGIMVTSLALVAAAWFVGASTASATVYTFQQGVAGYTGASSTYTEYQGVGDVQSFNYGAKTTMLVYTPIGEGAPKKTGFMMFELSSVATPVVVSSAIMTLNVKGDGVREPGFSQTFNIFPILRSGLDFGTGNGTEDPGAVTFNSSAYGSAGWGSSNTGNYGPVAGQDYSLASIGSFTLTDANAGESVISFSLDNATVASWINSPSTNYGFVIVSDAGISQAVIYTGNEAGAIYRPLLTIDAQAIPEPASMALLGLGAVAFLLRKRMSVRGRSA